MKKIKKIIQRIKMYGVSTSIQYIYIELNYLLRRIFLSSYSQMGEDLIISHRFPRNYKGFYVDVGANDPKRFNNTYLFYRRGWSGINIEPDVENFSKISKLRKRDINLNVGVAESRGSMDYYIFSPSTLNTFVKQEAESSMKAGFNLLSIEKVKVVRLEDILRKYIKNGNHIDFITIDTEGGDMNVLRSMNISMYKPRFVIVESTKHSVISDKSVRREVFDILKISGYKPIYSNSVNSIYEYCPDSK